MKEHTTCQVAWAKKPEEQPMHMGHPLAMVWGVLVLVGMAIIIGLLWKNR